MPRTRSPFFSYFLPSISDLVIFAFFLNWILFHVLLENFDIWWHIRTGELILSEGFPKVDVFSFTAAGRPWILHEWGCEVIFFFLYNTFDVAGLVVLRALIASLIFGLLFKLFLRLKVNLFLAVLLVIAASAALTADFLIRPQMFSVLFFILTFFIYNEYKMHARRKILYFLPVIFVVWINLHGGFIVGFLFLGLCIIGETVDNLLVHKTFFSPDQSRTNALFGVCVLSFMTCLFNPNTYKGLLYPLLYGSKEAIPLHYIAEWQPASWTNDKVFILLILFFMIIVSLSKSRFQLQQLMPIIFFAFYTFLHHRIVSFFALVTLLFMGPHLQYLIQFYYNEMTAFFGPSVRNHLYSFSNYLSDRSFFFTKIENTNKYHITLTILLVFISSVLITGNLSSLLPIGVSWDRFPTGNIKVLKKFRPEGNIFNKYRWGGILIKEFPNNKVFIDGRIDVYGPSIAAEYETVLELKKGWKDILSKYNVSHILVDKNSTIARLLIDIDPDWVMFSEDSNSKLFFKKPGIVGLQKTNNH